MDMVSSNPCPYTVSVNIYIGKYKYKFIYIYKYMGVDLKVHLGIFHYEGRQCYNMMRPCVFSGARESIFLAKDLAKDLF
jgi:hypothetical protein